MKLKPNFVKSLAKVKEDMKNGSKKLDERLWYPQGERNVDEMYEFYFLPSKPKNGEYGEICYDKIIYHKFEYLDRNGKKRNYFSPCPKMTGQDCPICDKVSELWEKEKDPSQAFTIEDESLRKKLSLKHRYITNVLIKDDPKNPENNGKVFLTTFPAKGQSVIFDMVLKQMNPSEIDLRKDSFEKFNPYEPFETAVFYYTYTAPKGKERFGNYSSSEFNTKNIGMINEDEDKLTEIIMSAHDLEEYLDEYCEKTIGWDETIEKIGHLLDGSGVIEIEKNDIKDEDIYGDDVEDEEIETKVETTEEVEVKDEKPEPEEEDTPKIEVKDDDDSLDGWG